MKNQVSVQIIADSVNEFGSRLTTFQVRVPKTLLQQIARHRVLSMSFNSARAIPGKTLRKQSDYEPIEYLSNKPGMSGGVELIGWRLAGAKLVWRLLSMIVKFGNYLLCELGLHKQHANRWLEPIAWVDGVLSATDWDNLIKLRVHPDAQPEFYQLAYQIKVLLENCKPQNLKKGEWHLPYIDSEEVIMSYSKPLISASRMARVSYGFNPVRDLEKDFKRAQMLLNSDPKHLSPFEGVAMSSDETTRSGNFVGWTQYRSMIENK
jgi:hypothetical protein